MSFGTEATDESTDFLDQNSSYVSDISLARFTRRRTTLTLSDKEYLRGTWPAVLLESFGRRLRSNVTEGDSDLHDREYSANSFAVPCLDFFLSHSWHAPWFAKYLTLLLHSNFWPAVMSYLVVIVTCSFGLRFVVGFRCYQNARSKCWMARLTLHVIGILSFFITMFSWHAVSVISGIRLKRVFFDKVCIHQSDIERKILGIQSIGAILTKSKTLLIAWDSTYFQRLWCAYELCTYIHSQPQGLIKVVPIHLSYFKVPVIILSFTLPTIRRCLRAIFETSGMGYLVGGVVVAILRACFTPSIRSYMWERKRLNAQISSFSVRATSCFCCDNGHKHPESGSILPCDRNLIYASIMHWHGHGNQEDALDNFDLRIRRALLLRIYHGPVGISYKFTVALGVCQNGSMLAMIIMFEGLNLSRLVFWLMLFISATCTEAAIAVGTSCYLAQKFAKTQSVNFREQMLDCALNLFIGAMSAAPSIIDDIIDDYIIDTFSLHQTRFACALLCGKAILLAFPLLLFFGGNLLSTAITERSQTTSTPTGRPSLELAPRGSVV